VYFRRWRTLSRKYSPFPLHGGEELLNEIARLVLHRHLISARWDPQKPASSSFREQGRDVVEAGDIIGLLHSEQTGRKVIRNLLRKGWLTRLRGGRCMLLPPERGAESLGENNPLAVAAAVVEGSDRLSAMRRPEARGVPFFFVRVDRAGNVSKRQSATDFHFSRLGGTCPLWNVYEAFAMPGRILTQVARMPDGRTYCWIARTVSRSPGSALFRPSAANLRLTRPGDGSPPTQLRDIDARTKIRPRS
jgi:hypothetical protein